MESWADVIAFTAKIIKDAENLAAYYKGEAERLEAENRSLRAHLKMMEVAEHAENALETAR